MRKHATMFDQGGSPDISVVNKATIPLGVNIDKLTHALQVYIDKYIFPVWGTGARMLPPSSEIKHGTWGLVFLDYADVEGALAYHTLTDDGLPISNVFVKTALRHGELVSVSTSHEIVEMLVDPAINMYVTGPDNRAMYAYETADPVEAFSFPVEGIEMSDFVYPSYFESFRQRKSAKFDHMGLVQQPFQILKGGYQAMFRDGRFYNIFANKEKEKDFAKEDRHGHRNEIRASRIGLDVERA